MTPLPARLVRLTITSIVMKNEIPNPFVTEKGVAVSLGASLHTSVYITFRQDATAANTKRECHCYTFSASLAVISILNGLFLVKLLVFNLSFVDVYARWTIL